MCDPVTLLLISTGVQAVGAIAEGRDAKRQADFSAAVGRQQAEREREIAGQDEEDFRRRQSRLFAQKRAALGASGVDSSTGSPLLAAKDFISEEEFMSLRILSGGQTKAARLEQGSTLSEMAGRGSLRQGFMRAGSSLLTGFNSAGFGKTPTATTTPGTNIKPLGPQKFTGGGCWVAREVYGEDNPEWLRFREYLFNDAPKWFMNLYLQYGEKFAVWISNKKLLKACIRSWMNTRINKGKI